MDADQIGDVIGIVAQHFKSAPHPKGGWAGDTNPWDASDYVRQLIERLSSNPTAHATRLLAELTDEPSLESYRDHLKHALASQRVRHIDSVYEQPNWRQVVDALENKAPANAADLHALVMAQLIDLRAAIAHSNTDSYKRFWNEDSYGRIDSPKPEESCRDVLVDLLRQRLQAIGLVVEPEGHMAKDKRVDISITSIGIKSLIELKRDYHAEVWTAAESQLDRLYSRDPDASGYGVYGVFWFGDKRPKKIPLNPDSGMTPKTATEMESMIRQKLRPEKRLRIEIVVLDVSGEIG